MISKMGQVYTCTWLVLVVSVLLSEALLDANTQTVIGIT